MKHLCIWVVSMQVWEGAARRQPAGQRGTDATPPASAAGADGVPAAAVGVPVTVRERQLRRNRFENRPTCGRLNENCNSNGDVSTTLLVRLPLDKI